MFQTRITEFLVSSGLKWKHVVLITIVLVIFALQLIAAAVLSISEQPILSLTLFPFILIHLLLIKSLGLNKNLKELIKSRQEASPGDDQQPSNFYIATACFAIFFIFYMLFHMALMVTDLQVDETSFVYTICMITGYLIVCIVFWPICKKRLK